MSQSNIRHVRYLCIFFFFFNDTATTEIYTLSLHDALPISRCSVSSTSSASGRAARRSRPRRHGCSSTRRDRKSTRLNSSHLVISYAVFCLKKKKLEAISLSRCSHLRPLLL